VKIIFSSHAWEEYLRWQEADRHILKRINALIKEICPDPFRGPGKPEPLKNALSGYWSRRINDEHRLVYKVAGNSLYLAQGRYHC